MKRDCFGVFDDLCKLAGNSAIVYSVIDHLHATLNHTPTADEIAAEIVKRRRRAERKVSPQLVENEGDIWYARELVDSMVTAWVKTHKQPVFTRRGPPKR